MTKNDLKYDGNAHRPKRLPHRSQQQRWLPRHPPPQQQLAHRGEISQPIPMLRRCNERGSHFEFEAHPRQPHLEGQRRLPPRRHLLSLHVSHLAVIWMEIQNEHLALALPKRITCFGQHSRRVRRSRVVTSGRTRGRGRRVPR